MTTVDLLDNYYARCVRSARGDGQLPGWPFEQSDDILRLASERLRFHGIALLLANCGADMQDWPSKLRQSLGEEARLQSLWEAGHADTVGGFINALYEADIHSLAMKGTALAYSVYSEPALRRRGDTDLLVEHAKRDEVRSIFQSLGFRPVGDRRVLQESWSSAPRGGFTHHIDLHWRINSSMTVSRSLERDHPRRRAIALPNLADHAKGTGLVDSFIHTCINRAAHDRFGYLVDDEQVFGGDRLIWAIDLDLLSIRFTPNDWDMLGRIARKCGASGIVSSGIVFARETLGSSVPEAILHSLVDSPPEGDTVSRYFATGSATKRMRRDLASSSDLKGKLAILIQHLFAGREFLNARYPGSSRWPLAALQVRRLLDASARMLLGGRR